MVSLVTAGKPSLRPRWFLAKLHDAGPGKIGFYTSEVDLQVGSAYLN
jgi:hypothetical protein